MTKLSVKEIIFLALLATGGVILRFFQFPIIPMAPFLTFDFSDLTAFIGLITNGPIGLMFVALVRDVINYLLNGGEAGLPIGVVMSFAGTLATFLPTHFIFKKLSITSLSYRHFIWIGIASTLSLTIVMGLMNYYFALPLYIYILNFPIDNITDYLLLAVIPFNLVKGILLSIGQWLVTKNLSNYFLKKRAVCGEYLNSSQNA